MLERTTSGLEPSRLKRLLPRVASARGKPSRAFHATAWCQSAASAASAVSAASSHRLQDGFFDMYAPEPPKTEPLAASVFLLDFLYPKGALALMQKSGSLRLAPPRALPPHAYGTPSHHPYASRFYSFSTAAPDSAPGGPGVEEAATVRDELDRLLRLLPQDRDLVAYDDAWSLYSRLDDAADAADNADKADKADKAEYARAVLLYLTTSRRTADADRILQLFDQLDVAQRNTAATAGAIAACLHTEDPARALDLFRHSTTTDAWSNDAPPGIDALLAHALRHSDWDYAADVWAVYRAKSELSKIASELLGAVAELPHLQDRLQAIHDYVYRSTQEVPRGAEPDERLVILQEVYKAVLEVSIEHVDPEHTYGMVKAMRNPRVFENFMRVAIDKGSPSLASQAFSKYRQLSNYRPHVSTLVGMVRIYYPDNVRGMEDVLKDWHNVKGRLNRWGYQKYLAFYASRGDVKAVYRMWDEFTTQYPGAIASGEDTFAHLLRVHAVRGDLTRLEQAFMEIRDKYKVSPNTVCWNIRLHLYVERGRYAEAMKVFEDLCGAVEPDDYSFSTIMAMVGGRGDLGLVSDLYWLAQQCGVRMTEAIIDPIVEAYCQNDRFDEAERLCVVTTREGKVHGAPYTSLWNTLVYQHALRHDLVAVNRILKLMTKLQVTYDADTYSGLIFALAQCRQPRRAVELLRAAQEDGIFRPTADHYTLLMMAYIRSKQPHRALQVNRLMHHMGFQRSSQQIQFVIKAFSQWQDFPKGAVADSAGLTSTDRRELFAKALREFQRSLNEGSRSMRSPQSTGPEAVRMHLGAVRRFSFIIFMLVQARDFAGVEEVMQLYKSIAPAEERDQPLPQKLCNALMLSDFYEGRFDRVKSMWATVLERAREIGRPQLLQETRLEALLGHSKTDSSHADADADADAASVESQLRQALAADDAFGPSPQAPAPKRPEHKIVAKMRYGLTDPLKTMQRLYTAERNADGLMHLVNDDILDNGFLLDSKNWNHYVQNLARLGRTREAFEVCETRLMGQWSGFASLRSRFGSQEWDGGSGSSSGSGSMGSRDSDDVIPGASRHNADGTVAGGGRRQGNNNNFLSPAAMAAAIAGDNNGSSDDPLPKFHIPNTRLSRAQQLRESATRFNRPMTFTFMVLAKAYLELEQAAMWSSKAERDFKDLSVRFPGTVYAVRTMVRMNSRIEGRVFGGGDEVDGLPIF